MNFSLIFCGFLSMVVVGVLLPWICRGGGGGFFFDFFFFFVCVCVVAVVVVDFYLIFCVVAMVVVDYLCCHGCFLCCYGGDGLFDFLWVSCGRGGGDGFFSGGSGGFLVTEVVVMGG